MAVRIERKGRYACTRINSKRRKISSESYRRDFPREKFNIRTGTSQEQ